jgi:beta-N-acetylhexosaminidase
MFGLAGTELRDEDIALFRDTRASGLILYRRNFESPEQLIALITGLESGVGRRLLVATDHEGGRVIMFGQGVSVFPDNLAVGQVGDETFAERQGLIEARELRRLGVDLNLGPCLDVLTDGYSPNIGIRSYGKDPGLVSRCGLARIRGMTAGGLSVCPKHFPGKGHSPLDAHLKLARIESTWEEMHARHLPPFSAAVAAGVDCVMTSHPVYPNLDPAGVPATFSRVIVDYLRARFQGVIVSDDLEMGAITEFCSIDEAAVRAASAGHDLLLVCHTESAQRAAHAALVDAYRSGELHELEASAERVRRLRRKREARFEDGPPRAEAEGSSLATEIARRAVTQLSAGGPDLASKVCGGRVVVVVPRLSALASRIVIEPEVADEEGFIARAFGRAGVRPTTIVVGVEPTDTEIAEAVAHASAADVAVLFLFDAHLYPSNQRLLDALYARSPALAVVLLRDPYDAALLPRGVLGLTAFGYRACQLDAVIERLLSP